MNATLTINTEGCGGRVELFVNGQRVHYAEFVSDADYTDFCATRHAVDFLRRINIEAAEKSVGHRPLDQLRKLYLHTTGELAWKLKTDSVLADLLSSVKRTLDDSQNPR